MVGKRHFIETENWNDGRWKYCMLSKARGKSAHVLKIHGYIMTYRDFVLLSPDDHSSSDIAFRVKCRPSFSTPVSDTEQDLQSDVVKENQQLPFVYAKVVVWTI